jgi:hypothetical protein
MIYTKEISIFAMTKFCIGILRLPSDIEIDIEVSDLSKEGVKGWCYNDSDTFFIQITDGLSSKEMAITLFHELVHVWQYYKGKPANEEQAYGLEELIYNRWVGKYG